MNTDRHAFFWTIRIATFAACCILIIGGFARAQGVITHELGHFIVRKHKIRVADEESFCDRFAEKLLKLKAV